MHVVSSENTRATTNGMSVEARIGIVKLPGCSSFVAGMIAEILAAAADFAGATVDHIAEIDCSDGYFRVLSVDKHGQRELCHTRKPYSVIFLVGGRTIVKWRDKELQAWLRERAAAGCIIGGIGSGIHILAEFGLLNGTDCVLHWEHVAGFRERFHDIEATAGLYRVDGKRFTCAGGAAALDLVLVLIRQWYGTETADKVAAQMLCGVVRRPDELEISDHLGSMRNKPAALKKLVGAIHENVEEPLSLKELARLVNLSTRQVQRLFLRHMGVSPSAFYHDVRLRHARLLLEQTNLPVTEVGLACGFVNPSQFSRSYKCRFGTSPSRERWNGPQVEVAAARK